MVRKRGEVIIKDRTPHKCGGCQQVWVSENALNAHTKECALYIEKAEAAIQAASAIPDVSYSLDMSNVPYRKRASGGRAGRFHTEDRIVPSTRALKTDIQYLQSQAAEAGIAEEDRVMPREGRMYVTPGMARFWLFFNKNNIEPAYDRIEEYAQEMLAGRWYDSRSPICFRDNGNLCQGQNRLLAHYYTGTGFEYLIATGVTEEEEAVMDIGRKRTVANFLSRGGKIDHHRYVSTVAGILWSHDAFPQPFNGVRTFRARPVATQSVIMPFVQDHPEIEDTVRTIYNDYRPAARLVNKGQTGIVLTSALWILMSRRWDRTAVEAFWQGVASGNMIAAGEPVYALREQLIRASANPQLVRTDSIETMARVIKAFNDHMSGKTRKLVVWREGEPFPSVN